jgi:plasmid stabilization system protein ParE
MMRRLIGCLPIASNEVRYTMRARADLAAIFANLTGRSPSYAQAVRQEIRHRIGQLTDFPLMGQQPTSPVSES